MKTAIANEQLDAIIKKVEKKGLEAPKLIEDLKALRELAIKEQDPLVVKVLRLAYEFISVRVLMWKHNLKRTKKEMNIQLKLKTMRIFFICLIY